jgi:hypothetical protein
MQKCWNEFENQICSFQDSIISIPIPDNNDLNGYQGSILMNILKLQKKLKELINLSLKI